MIIMRCHDVYTLIEQLFTGRYDLLYIYLYSIVLTAGAPAGRSAPAPGVYVLLYALVAARTASAPACNSAAYSGVCEYAG